VGEALNVLVPYVRLHPALLDALARDGVTAEFVETFGRGDYAAALTDAWQRCEPFIVVEQDKVPEPGLLKALWECEQPWCSVRVGMRGTKDAAAYPSLSCTKFGAQLMLAWPELMDDVSCLDVGLGEGEWSRLDLAIAGLLRGVRGWDVHWHTGVVQHLHEEEVAA
jgi:hypothetical protein